jgi:hypothetical protein
MLNQRKRRQLEYLLLVDQFGLLFF